MNDMTKSNQAQLAATNRIDEMFGGGGFQIPIDAPLPKITILREKPMFELPDGEIAKTVTGHIIYWHHASQYYATKFGEGDQGPPDCCSSNGIKPDGGSQIQAAACRQCPHNEYGSGSDGRGKACQNTIRLYVLVDGEVIPNVLTASPSSLNKKGSLMRWLTNAPNIAAKAGAGTKYQPIKVSFSLHTRDFDSGFSASVLDVQTLKVLDPADSRDLDYLKRLARLFSEFMEHYFGRISKDVAGESMPSDEDIPI